MKKLLSIIAICLCIGMVFCSCSLKIGGGTTVIGGDGESQTEGGDNSSGGGKSGNNSKSGGNTSKSGGNTSGTSSQSKPGTAVDHKLAVGGSCVRNRASFTVPTNLMTTEQYHKEFQALLKASENYVDASAAFMKKVDDLDIKLQDQIVYNLDDVKTCKGTHYYVSATGSDSNDGKSPEKPWQTLKKVNTAALKSGDLVSFKRGDVFRGVIQPKSGVTYGAYGNGFKPQICASYDAKQWKWVATDTKNVWKLDHKFLGDNASNYGLSFSLNMAKDLSICVLVDPDGTEHSGTHAYSIKDLKSNYKFVYRGAACKDEQKDHDYYIYMYYDKGNPGDAFTDIEIGLNSSVFNENNKYIENVSLNNLELLYGRGPFWPGDCKNISVTYCIAGWQGGFDDGSQGVPYGGGGGVWGSCDGFLWDHCYIFQQWDSGVSPQYKGSSNPVVTYKDFITTNCIFKGCRWTLEYWLQQNETTSDKIEHMVFEYNLCRDGGSGFNPTRKDSAYVQNWGYENSCYNSSISYNLFDRPYARTYEIGGFEQIEPAKNGNSAVDKFSLDRMPSMNHNIHIQTEKKQFALVHKGCEYKNANYDLYYKYTVDDLKKFVADGIEKDSLFLFGKR